MSTMFLIIGAWCLLLRSERGCSEIFLMSRTGLSICFCLLWLRNFFYPMRFGLGFSVCLGMDTCHFETYSVEESPAKVWCYSERLCLEESLSMRSDNRFPHTRLRLRFGMTKPARVLWDSSHTFGMTFTVMLSVSEASLPKQMKRRGSSSSSRPLLATTAYHSDGPQGERSPKKLAVILNVA